MADHPGHANAGVVELEEQAVYANHHQDQGNSGRSDRGQKARAPPRLEFHDFSTGRGKQDFAAAFQSDLAPIHLFEKVGNVLGHQVDDLLVQCFPGRQTDGFAYRLLRPFGIAAAQLGQAPDIGCGIAHGLLGHGIPGCRLALFARSGGRTQTGYIHRDGRGRAQIGAWRHSGDMAGVQDVGPCAGRARAAGRNKGCDRHRRSQDVLDDGTHGSIQAARGVHAQHDELRTAVHGVLDAARDMVGCGRPDCAVEIERQHRFGKSRAQCQPKQQRQCAL